MTLWVYFYIKWLARIDLRVLSVIIYHKERLFSQKYPPNYIQIFYIYVANHLCCYTRAVHMIFSVISLYFRRQNRLQTVCAFVLETYLSFLSMTSFAFDFTRDISALLLFVFAKRQEIFWVVIWIFRKSPLIRNCFHLIIMRNLRLWNSDALKPTW